MKTTATTFLLGALVGAALALGRFLFADVLRRYMARLVATQTLHRLSVIVSTAVLPSANTARWIRANVKGAPMSEAVITRLEQAGDAEQEGVRIASELLTAVRDIPGVAGVNVMTPGELATIAAAIEAAGLRR